MLFTLCYRVNQVNEVTTPTEASVIILTLLQSYDCPAAAVSNKSRSMMHDAPSGMRESQQCGYGNCSSPLNTDVTLSVQSEDGIIGEALHELMRP